MAADTWKMVYKPLQQVPVLLSVRRVPSLEGTSQQTGTSVRQICGIYLIMHFL